MKQLAQKDVSARAWLFTEGVVRLRIGGADFAMDIAEAEGLAHQLTVAVGHGARLGATP
jgi:hypothetical protein